MFCAKYGENLYYIHTFTSNDSYVREYVREYVRVYNILNFDHPSFKVECFGSNIERICVISTLLPQMTLMWEDMLEYITYPKPQS